MEYYEKLKKLFKLEHYLLSHYNQVALGYGNLNAEYMFIGINPNKDIEFSGVRCFYENSDKHHASAKAFLTFANKYIPDNYYITNLVKIPTENNIKPSPGMVIEFLKYLQREIEIVQPKVIVSLGNWVYEILTTNNINTVKICHPAYIQRSNNYELYDTQFDSILIK